MGCKNILKGCKEIVAVQPFMKIMGPKRCKGCGIEEPGCSCGDKYYASTDLDFNEWRKSELVPLAKTRICVFNEKEARIIKDGRALVKENDKWVYEVK